ncbi:MAG: dihydrodipicolinate synthase family protein [Chloroflexi bacterium]|nr:dihydrodipicolinate synthase family protein [Chloroflexota bacterium]
MKPENIREWLRGPMVAVATPFTEDFKLDLDALKSNIRVMIDRGVTTGNGTLLVGGAGGEHPTLSIQERKDVMSASMEAANGEVPVLSSIQHTDYRSIIDMAKHAESIGLQGAQLGPTYYYEPTEDDAYRLFELVANESDITLMLYHTWWEGLTMSLALVERIVSLPTVRSVKWSSPDPAHYRTVMKEMSGDVAFIDNSNSHIQSHIYGALGFITHLSGFWPEYPLKIWQQLEAHDYTAAEETLAAFKWKWTEWRSQVAAVTGGEGPFIKAAMEEAGLPAGPPRPPSIRPPGNLLKSLKELFDECGVPRV